MASDEVVDATRMNKSNLREAALKTVAVIYPNAEEGMQHAQGLVDALAANPNPDNFNKLVILISQQLPPAKMGDNATKVYLGISNAFSKTLGQGAQSRDAVLREAMGMLPTSITAEELGEYADRLDGINRLIFMHADQIPTATELTRNIGGFANFIRGLADNI